MMPTVTDLKARFQEGEFDSTFAELYGPGAIESQRARYLELLRVFSEKFSDTDISIHSAPGRTELSGNHTDHNHGCVLAAGIQLDKIAAVSPRDDMRVVLWTEGFDAPIDISLDNIAKMPHENGKADALVRGLAARLTELGLTIGGFSGYIMSDVAPGSGLSSSASFEVLVGSIFDHLYNKGDTDPVVIAQAGQYAENEYFGKPCGLMDQTACAVGGIMSIDFNDPVSPVIDRVTFDFAEQGYDLVVVDTGGNHADLTPDYAAVPKEMKALAASLGHEVCRQLTLEDVMGNIERLRDEVGDRAILRGLHFLSENRRVSKQVQALKESDLSTYFDLVRSSGDSSWKLLQNVYSPHAADEQGVTLALAFSGEILGSEGAFRVHGGGFAGTIQAYVPVSAFDNFASVMAGIFGKDSVTRLRIRQTGIARIA